MENSERLEFEVSLVVTSYYQFDIYTPDAQSGKGASIGHEHDANRKIPEIQGVL